MSNLTSLLDEKTSSVVNHVDHINHETAGTFHAAADSIRQSGRQGSKAIQNIAEAAADKLDSAASYVRKYELKKLIGNGRRILRQYPAELLAVAAALGFVAGIALCRLTHSRPEPAN